MNETETGMLWPGLPTKWRWFVMLAVSLPLALLFKRLSIPASTLLAAMGTGIFFAASGWNMKVPRPPFCLCQGMVGCLIAGSITARALSEVGRNWILVAAMVVSVSAISSLLGWLLARTGVLPGSTAIWGVSPGAALLMTILSDRYGGDSRLVAFMQYLRVMLVAVTAAVVTWIWVPEATATAAALAKAAQEVPGIVACLPALGLAVVGAGLGLYTGHASIPILFPLVVGGILSGFGIMRIVLPEWLLFAAYILIGWSIGLRFTRKIVLYAFKVFPKVFATIAGLIIACALLGAVFGPMAGLDPLTAYLATSPGGMDAIAIIAASTDANLPFIMAVQTARFILVTLTGPAIATYITKKTRLSERE